MIVGFSTSLLLYRFRRLEASSSLGSHVDLADGGSSSSFAFDSQIGGDPSSVSGFVTHPGDLLNQPSPRIPASPRSSHEAEIEGENGSSLFLSPRAFDSLDCLPSENLNSVSSTPCFDFSRDLRAI